MEKSALKGKKEIRTVLADTLHEAIKTLGVSKSPKRMERALDKTSRKLANQLVKQLKKDLKKSNKEVAKSKKTKQLKPEPIAA